MAPSRTNQTRQQPSEGSTSTTDGTSQGSIRVPSHHEPAEESPISIAPNRRSTSELAIATTPVLTTLSSSATPTIPSTTPLTKPSSLDITESDDAADGFCTRQYSRQLFCETSLHNPRKPVYALPSANSPKPPQDPLPKENSASSSEPAQQQFGISQRERSGTRALFGGRSGRDRSTFEGRGDWMLRRTVYCPGVGMVPVADVAVFEKGEGEEDAL